MKALSIAISVFAGVVSAGILAFLYLPDGGVAVRLFVEMADGGFRFDLVLTTALLVVNLAAAVLVGVVLGRRMLGAASLVAAGCVLLALAAIDVTREVAVGGQREASSPILMFVSVLHVGVLFFLARGRQRMNPVARA